MSTKIKDLLEIAPASSRTAAQRGSAGRLSSFLLSYEIGDAIARTVERLAPSGEGPHNALIVGGPGCGKSRLLEAVGALVDADPPSPLHPRLTEIRALLGDCRCLVVPVPETEGPMRLSAAIERATLERLAAAGFAPAPAGEEQRGRLDAAARAIASLPERYRVVYLVDNLDRWLDAAARYALENAHALVRLGELSRELPVSVCAAAGEYVLSHDSGASGQGWIAAMLDTYRIEYVSSRALRSAAASNVLVKNARQRREILDVLKLLRAKLPDLECTDEAFVELYPLESSTWTLGSHLHRWIGGFSLPDFAERAAESVKRRPAPSLFALNDMFTLYEPQLRHVEALAPVFDAYDRLVAGALPRLGQSQRLWGRLALQSIFMHTLAGIAADVKTIAHSALLYDLHDGTSSYSMMSAVLKQLETLDDGRLVASGEGTARRYSLVTGEREALMVLVEKMADAVEPEEAAAGLLGVGGSFFADWPFASPAAEGGRLDLWEIEQGTGWIALEARSIAGAVPSAARPRLVLFAPGRPWSEANEEARRSASTACWIGAMPTPTELETLRRWLAATRLAKSDRGRRFAELGALLAGLEAQTADVFRRVYVDGGTRVAANRSDSVADFVRDSQDESLVVRLLPTATDGAAAPPPGALPEHEALWLAHLLADDRSAAAEMAAHLDERGWRQRLESWYGARVTRDDASSVRRLGERGGDVPAVVEALDAKQLFDVAVYYVRRALTAGSLGGLGEALEKLFESHDGLWEARARLSWLDELAGWVPELEWMVQYLGAAETVADPEVEEVRQSLLVWADRFGELVDARRRKAFADAFGAYREEYARIYAARHDETVGAATIDRSSDEIVSGGDWRALEALSSLSIGVASYLVDAINMISALRGAQCSADAAASLSERPVCGCGFRFAERERVEALRVSAVEFVAAGIEHHRRLLQERRAELRDGLIASKSAFSIETMRAIAELTKEGPLPAIDQETIGAINALLADKKGEWIDRGADDDRSETFRAKGV